MIIDNNQLFHEFLKQGLLYWLLDTFRTTQDTLLSLTLQIHYNTEVYSQTRIFPSSSQSTTSNLQQDEDQSASLSLDELFQPIHKSVSSSNTQHPESADPFKEAVGHATLFLPSSSSQKSARNAPNTSSNTSSNHSNKLSNNNPHNSSDSSSEVPAHNEKREEQYSNSTVKRRLVPPVRTQTNSSQNIQTDRQTNTQLEIETNEHTEIESNTQLETQNSMPSEGETSVVGRHRAAVEDEYRTAAQTPHTHAITSSIVTFEQYLHTPTDSRQ